jgi:hypothetical protein
MYTAKKSWFCRGISFLHTVCGLLYDSIIISGYMASMNKYNNPLFADGIVTYTPGAG